MKYNGETIIMIEYFNDVPYSVITDGAYYDFDLHAEGWLMFTRSVWIGHKNKKILYNTELSEKQNCKIWVDPEYTIEIKYPEGIQLITDPIELPQYFDIGVSTNPFKIGVEVVKIYYCEKCKAHYSETGCITHSGFVPEA